MKKLIIFGLVFLGLMSGAFALDVSDVTYYYSIDNDNRSGNTIYDLDGNVDATASSVTLGATGILEEAGNFANVNNYIDTNSAINSGTNGFSISWWFKADTWLNAPMHFQWDDGGSNRIMYAQQLSAGNELRIASLGSTTGDVRFSGVNLSQWYHVVITKNNGNGLNLYVNGNLVDSDAAATQVNSKSVKNRIGHHIALVANYNYDGFIDEFAMFNKVLNSYEIETLYNEGAGLAYPFILGSTPTINHNLSNYYNYENISIALNTSTNTNMSYVLDSGSETSICSDCNSITLNLYNLSEQVHNIIFISTDEFGQVNTSVNFTNDYTAPNISIIGPITQDFEVDFSTIFNVTDALSGLASCTINITYLENVTNASQYDTFINCTDTEIFSANGLYNGYIEAYDNAGNLETLSINGTIQAIVSVNFFQPNGSQISNYDYELISPNGYSESISNTSNPVEISPVVNGSLDLGNWNLTFTKYGFATTSFIIPINVTSGGEELNYTIQIATLYIEIYDVDNLNLITQQVDIDLIGTNFAGTFSTSNGTITILNITDLPDTYELALSSSGYENLNYYFQHTGYAAVELSLYMQNTSDTIPIKYIIQDTFGDPYDLSTCLVELQIYQISTNSYESFVMDYTNSIAEVIFNLDTTEKYKPIVTCGSITQVYDGGKITSTPVYLKFSQSSLELFPTIPSISSSITFVDVSNTTGRFKFTYNDLNNIISEACLEVTEISYGTETLLDTQCLSTSSGSINIDFTKTGGLTYKAEGFVTYEGEDYSTNTYYKKIPLAEFDFGIWGVIFGLVIIGLLAIAGFFMGKAKGVLIGTTIGLWIMSFAMFGVWFMPVSTALIVWSVLLIVGVIFS